MKGQNLIHASKSISFSSLLFLVFLFLKLANIGIVATWSWWWVTSPLWIPFVIVGALLIFFILIKVFL